MPLHLLHEQQRKNGKGRNEGQNGGNRAVEYFFFDNTEQYRQEQGGQNQKRRQRHKTVERCCGNRLDPGYAVLDGQRHAHDNPADGGNEQVIGELAGQSDAQGIRIVHPLPMHVNQERPAQGKGKNLNEHQGQGDDPVFRMNPGNKILEAAHIHTQQQNGHNAKRYQCLNNKCALF